MNCRESGGTIGGRNYSIMTQDFFFMRRYASCYGVFHSPDHVRPFPHENDLRAQDRRSELLNIPCKDPPFDTTAHLRVVMLEPRNGLLGQMPRVEKECVHCGAELVNGFVLTPDVLELLLRARRAPAEHVQLGADLISLGAQLRQQLVVELW